MGSGLALWGQGWLCRVRAGFVGSGLALWGQGWLCGVRAGTALPVVSVL